MGPRRYQGRSSWLVRGAARAVVADLEDPITRIVGYKQGTIPRENQTHRPAPRSDLTFAPIVDEKTGEEILNLARFSVLKRLVVAFICVTPDRDSLLHILTSLAATVQTGKGFGTA